MDALLSLPDAWLEQLMLTLGDEGMLRLFSSCQAGRKLILRHRRCIKVKGPVRNWPAVTRLLETKLDWTGQLDTSFHALKLHVRPLSHRSCM